MNRFVQDGAARLRQAYGEEAGARVDAGIQLLNRRYRRQMASARLTVRVRLWLRLRLARRHLRKTVEAAYFGRERLYLGRMPWHHAGGAPARDAPAAQRDVSDAGGSDQARRPGDPPAQASAGELRRT